MSDCYEKGFNAAMKATPNTKYNIPEAIKTVVCTT